MVLNSLLKKKKDNTKSLSVLIDPDKIDHYNSLEALINFGKEIDFFFVGGSLLVSEKLNALILHLKNKTNVPVILFPGSNLHITKHADAILFLSLISGRNPDLLIGQHVAAAPIIKNSNLEVLPTGYILIGNSLKTTVVYVSHTIPIPTAKSDIAVCTAMAGEMLGMKLIYLDAGSGADEEVPTKMISEVRNSIDVPLIVGGGINSAGKAERAYQAGADMLVFGTAVEKNVTFLKDVIEIRNRMNH